MYRRERAVLVARRFHTGIHKSPSQTTHLVRPVALVIQDDGVLRRSSHGAGRPTPIGSSSARGRRGPIPWARRGPSPPTGHP